MYVKYILLGVIFLFVYLVEMMCCKKKSPDQPKKSVNPSSPKKKAEKED